MSSAPGQTERIAIIADDYTGAGDAGVHFARFGRQIELLLDPHALADPSGRAGDVALSSETRFLLPADAASVTSGLVRSCRLAGFDRIFKKIDSTMRGNPGSEIAAVLTATGHAAALICPAMPKTGRTCRDGTIYVDDTPLHLSDIGSDPFHPLTTSSVVDLLRLQTDLPIARLSLADVAAGGAQLQRRLAALLDAGSKLIVADALEDSHLAALAVLVRDNDLLPVGAGGFAEASAALGMPAQNTGSAKSALRMSRPLVAVVGSMAEASRRQADHAARSGRFVVVEIDAEASHEQIDHLCDARLAELSEASPNLLLRVASPPRTGRLRTQEGERVAEKLGHAVVRLCRRTTCRTVVSTGGSTAMAIAHALGIASVRLVDEILPGIVAGTCEGTDTGVEWFVSKAGGFGAETLLTEIDDRCVTGGEDVPKRQRDSLGVRG